MRARLGERSKASGSANRSRSALDALNDTRYVSRVIRSFADRDTARLADRRRVKRFEAIERVALRKLETIRAAEALEDLPVPPGNRLEALRGDRAGQHSIRVNDQWRICFRWVEGEAHDVEICDDH